MAAGCRIGLQGSAAFRECTKRAEALSFTELSDLWNTVAGEAGQGPAAAHVPAAGDMAPITAVRSAPVSSTELFNQQGRHGLWLLAQTGVTCRHGRPAATR